MKFGNIRSGTSKLRYGIVNYKDAINDLKEWNTLVTSQFMNKPHQLILLEDDDERPKGELT